MVTSRSEKCNYVRVEYGSREFCDFIESSKMIDLPLIGRKFMWYGSRNKRSRLDRFLVDEF